MLIELLELKLWEAEHFCPPSRPPPKKIPALTGLIKRKILLYTLHIALESITQLKYSALQLMMNHDVYLSKMFEGLILSLHPVICVDVEHQAIFSIKPSPSLKKEKLCN